MTRNKTLQSVATVSGLPHNLVTTIFFSKKDFPQMVMALNSSEISSSVFPLVSGRKKKV